MKNAATVAQESTNGTKIYFSIKENAVYTEDGNGRYYVTELIRPNTEAEIEKAVRKWLAM